MSTDTELVKLRATMVLEELTRREALVGVVQAKSLSPVRLIMFMLVLLAFFFASTWLPWEEGLASHPRVMRLLVGFGVAMGVIASIGTVVVASRIGALVKLLDRSGLFSQFVKGASDPGNAAS